MPRTRREGERGRTTGDNRDNLEKDKEGDSRPSKVGRCLNEDEVVEEVEVAVEIDGGG